MLFGIQGEGLPQDLIRRDNDPLPQEGRIEGMGVNRVALPVIAPVLAPPIADRPSAGVITLDSVQNALKQAANATPNPKRLIGLKKQKKLSGYNKKLAIVESQLKVLAGFIDKAEKGKLPILDNLKAIRDELNLEHRLITEEKGIYVKTAYPDNPAYAMARPITVPQGSVFWTATSDKGLKDRLFDAGFSWFDNERSPATCYATDFVHYPDRWENEMGEKGFYFTKDHPDYLTEGSKYELALKCVLEKEMDGVAMLPVSKLAARSFGFSKEQIDKGYRTLQKNYSVVKCDESISTEYVFQRTDNNLKPSKIITIRNRDRELTIGEYFKRDIPLHKSWGKQKKISAPKSSSRTLITGIALAGIACAALGIFAMRSSVDSSTRDVTSLSS